MTAIPHSETRFHGWRVVAAAFVLAMFGWGLGFYGPPIYLQSVREARAWSLPLVSAAVTVHFLIGALVVANMPALHRRFGLPVVTKAGIVALALGICGWAYATAPWQLFVATLFSGAGWVGLGPAAINAIVARWFVRNRPAALGMAYNGASIGGVVFSPLLAASIATLGFGHAALILGAVAVAAVWFLSDAFFSRSPEEMGQVVDGNVAVGAIVSSTRPEIAPLPGRLLWRNRRFITLATGMALGLFAQIGLIAHLFSLLSPTLGTQIAGWAMALATACAIGGRTLVGWLMPPGADRRLVSAASYLVQIVGSVAFMLSGGTNPALLALGIILFGSGIGNATSLPPLIAQVEFSREDSARAVALIVASAQATYAFAPAAFGMLRDLSAAMGSLPFFAAAACIQALAIICFLAERRRTA